MANTPPRARPCPNLADNKRDCPCTSQSCPNHGKCCSCVASHRAAGDRPACLR